MINHLNAQLAIDARNTLGEGPIWDAAGSRFLWSDIKASVIHEAEPDGVGGWHESRRWNLNRSLSVAIPRATGGLVVVGGTEIFMLDEAGKPTPFVRLPDDPAVMSFNDAKCDSQGRLWAGTYAYDHSPRGALYRIDPGGTMTQMLEHVMGSNGLDWSPDGSTFYYIDSTRQIVDAFDFDMMRGTISNRRTIVTIQRGGGIPDGMTVDREGCLWVAVAGRGVWRYGADGTPLAYIEASTPMVTSCAFGGVDGGDLFITSVSMLAPSSALPLLGFSAERAEKAATAPGAGGLFVCRPGTSGTPATPFAG